MKPAVSVMFVMPLGQTVAYSDKKRLLSLLLNQRMSVWLVCNDTQSKTEIVTIARSGVERTYREAIAHFFFRKKIWQKLFCSIAIPHVQLPQKGWENTFIWTNL